MAMAKSNGDRGHPWRVPRDKVKYSELTLLVETEACGSTYNKCIHDINPSPKPNSFRTLNR